MSILPQPSNEDIDLSRFDEETQAAFRSISQRVAEGDIVAITVAELLATSTDSDDVIKALPTCSRYRELTYDQMVQVLDVFPDPEPAVFDFPPCPQWCQVEHDTAADIEFGARIHERVVWKRVDNDNNLWQAYVRLGSVDGVDERHNDPLELVVSRRDDPMEPDEARAFAAAIIEGARLVDEIRGGSTPR